MDNDSDVNVGAGTGDVQGGGDSQVVVGGDTGGGDAAVVDTDLWAGIEIGEEYTGIKAKYKSPNDALKALTEAQKLLGKKTLSRPTAESTDEEKQAWRKHIGVPDKLEEYDFEFAEDIKAHVDSKYFADAKQKAFDQGFTKEQFEFMVNLRFDEHRNAQEMIRNIAVQKTEECRLALRREWGDDVESYTKEVYDIAKKNGVYDALSQTGMLNNPDVVKFIHQAAAAMNDGGVPSVETVKTTDGQIQALKNSDAYKNIGHKDHNEAMRRLFELNSIKAKSLSAKGKA